ncbi:MAG: glycoside hydrolase family 25 protein [Lachnospiraceae bacterium]|nr:glycoside hydrolase family 25 protein [Lachnospiraceae bacterium]
MQRNRIKTLNLIIILLILVTIMALTFVGILGALYIKERNVAERLESENIQLQDQVSDLTFSLEEAQEIDENMSDTGENENVQNEESVPAMNMQMQMGDSVPDTEAQITESVKQKMKELVVAEDGSPLKMLREFFPENLIYYDEKQYVFAPVLDEVKKHDLLSENFVENDKGEMQYVENGVVTSHKGIDVSKYQGDIDWKAVKEDGVEYAFVRLGLRGYESGKLVLDEYFDKNMRGANEADVAAGVYFFTQAITVEEAKEEAAYVLENITEYDVTCPIVFDVEMIVGANGRANNLTKEERTDITIAFCEVIRQAGYTPMIYGNVKCFTKMLDLARLEDYEKWYAFYDNYMYIPYEVSCWQYTEKGTVKGIKNKVDLNISYKTW